MNTNILAVVTPPSIYHGYYTWKKFWDGNFTLCEFTTVNMKIVVFVIIGNTGISRMVRSTSTWTSL